MPFFPVNKSSKEPLFAAVYLQVRNAIKDGFTGRLPSKNQASEIFEVSKITIERAYNQLLTEGYIFSRPRSGYFVNVSYCESILKLEQKEPLVYNVKDKVSYKFDLSTYQVDSESFPFDVWSRISRKILREERQHLLNSTAAKGTLDLRQQIAVYLRDYRGIEAHPEQLVIGAGTEWISSLFIQLLRPRNIFAIENPGYAKLRKILYAHSLQVEHIPMTENGISLDALEQIKPEVVHITPSHHFPLGSIMPVQQRLELIKAAEKLDFYIIEDDYDSEIRFEGRPIPALQSLAKSERVIYINTFAKSLAPSLRISYMLLPPALLTKFEKEFYFYSCTVPGFEQYVLAEFMKSGQFARHLNRVRNLYKVKHDCLIEKLQKSKLMKNIIIRSNNAGMHFLLQYKGKLDEKEMIEKAAKKGIKLSGLSEFYGEKKNIPPSTVVIGFAKIDENKVAELVKKLEKAWME